ncbi:MAG TPA: cytochrome c biogenesis protein CcdA [Vicinamibacterales bacterium]|nr:cytochrome c biogenesis protein CcdA [Vicinamibacterales bacterium]
MRSALAVALALAFVAPSASAAPQDDPVTWSAKAVTRGLAPGRTFDVAITGVAEDEWHIYSVTQGPGGPVPTTIAIPRGGMFTRNGAIRGPVPATAFDPNFEIRTETYDGTFTLVLPLRLAPDARATSATLQVEVGFQACTNRLCLPPKTITLDVPVRWVVGAARLEVAPAVPDAAPPEPKAAGATATPGPPVPDPRPPASFGAAADSWGAFLWLAVSMGALSLLTPCVFPMVPITVSYFTNHAAPTRARAAGSAALYGLGIVLTFTVLGSVLAAVAGAAGLNRFAANPWVNLGITALFLLFALNLFGLYELRLPVGLMSRLDGMSRRRGPSAAGTLLMALTFTITSLTCTAAFIGTLLVVAAQGEWQRPIAGLLAYSTTFALPFVALAMAPQLVSQLPRSGPWLARVKIVMGFLEIAAAMKFLSNADLVWSWGLFTRTVVLAVWVVTAIALAIYLLRDRPRAGRLAAAAATLGLAAWLGTGLRGRPLGELEAFLPPAAAHASSNELAWITNDLDAALAQARASGQLVIIDFTGYTCTNCRWMEANMFPRPDVRAELGTFVRARLYTDGQGPLYMRQQRFQQERFRTVALPLYAIIDSEQRPVATFAGLTRDQDEFLRFLRSR